jgi:transposase
MAQVDDLSRSLTPFEQDRTLVAVLEMSQASWLAAAVVPGLVAIHRSSVIKTVTDVL